MFVNKVASEFDTEKPIHKQSSHITVAESIRYVGRGQRELYYSLMMLVLDNGPARTVLLISGVCKLGWVKLLVFTVYHCVRELKGNHAFFARSV